jgi:hypothetical protein
MSGFLSKAMDTFHQAEAGWDEQSDGMVVGFIAGAAQ